MFHARISLVLIGLCLAAVAGQGHNGQRGSFNRRSPSLTRQSTGGSFNRRGSFNRQGSGLARSPSMQGSGLARSPSMQGSGLARSPSMQGQGSGPVVAPDVMASLDRMAQVVCSPNSPNDQMLYTWSHCSDNVRQVGACRNQVYGSVLDNRAKMAVACRGGEALQQQYYNCVGTQVAAAGLDINALARKAQMCEKAALRIQ